MALQKTTVSINLGQSLDQKDDAKTVGGLGHDIAENVVHNKLGRLDKAPGTNKLTTTKVTSFPSPLAIGSSTQPSKVIAHKQELLLQNKGCVYSYSPKTPDWIFKSHLCPVEVTTQKLTNKMPYQLNSDSASLNGMTVIAYEVVDFLSVHDVRYSVIEEATGAYLIKDALVRDNTSATPRMPKVVKFSNAIWILLTEGTVILGWNVNLTDGTIPSPTSPVTLRSDMVSAAGYYDFAMASSSSAVGEACFVVYPKTTGLNVFAFNSSGTPLSATDCFINGIANGSSNNNGLAVYIHDSVSASRFYIATNVTPGSNGITIYGYNFNASLVYSSAFTPVKVQTSNLLTKNIGMCLNPNTLTDIYVFYDTLDAQAGYLPASGTPAWKVQKVYTAKLYYSQFAASNAALMQDTVLISPNTFITTKPLLDLTRNTIYFGAVVDTAQQSTDFVLDFLRGNASRTAYPIASFNYGFSQGQTSGSGLGNFSLRTSDNKYFYTHGYKARISSIVTAEAGSIAGTQIGISQNILDLSPQPGPSYRYLQNATHMTGGFLADYDGVSFGENNFLIGPELFHVEPTNTAVTLTVAAFNDYKINFNVKGCLYPVNSSVGLDNNYILVYNDANQAKQVWWYFDTERNSPPATVPGATLVQVVCNEWDTAADIAQKTKTALAVVLPTRTITLTGDLTNGLTYLRVTGGTGSWSVPTAKIDQLFGSMTAGSYQYTVCYTYTDRNGQIHRSQTATPLTMTMPNTQSAAGILIWYHPLTIRDATQVRVEVYRTVVGGTTFYKINNFSVDPSWMSNQANLVSAVGTVPPAPSYGPGVIYYFDFNSDSQIQNFEELYTTGGVQDNVGLGACSALTVYKDRLLTVPTDNQSTIAYSKAVVTGSPVSFTEFQTNTVGSDGAPITALAVLDDKLLVFKKNQIYYVAGDGANALGSGSSFSTPVLIASDVGALSQNSVAVTPLGVVFQSQKGIYVIDRSLTTQFIGLAVIDYKSNTISKTEVIQDDSQVRFVLSDVPVILIYDYKFGRWSVRTNSGGTGACNWQNQFTRVDSSGGVYVENKAIFTDVGSSSTSYHQKIQTKWLHVKDMQDWSRIWRLSVVGELKSAHTLTFTLWYDYDENNADTYTFNSSSITGTGVGDAVYQPQIHLKRQKCQAIRVQLEVTPVGGTEECLTLTDLSLEIGLKAGLAKVKLAKKL